jgi:hypothetical protein
MTRKDTKNNYRHEKTRKMIIDTKKHENIHESLNNTKIDIGHETTRNIFRVF